MLDWLTDSIDLFGLPTQNWMLLLAAGFLLYIVAIMIPRRGRPHAR